MSDLAYDFTFPPAAAGLTVTVTSADGDVVSSGTLTGDLDDNGRVAYQVSLPESDSPYTGTVSSSTLGTLQTQGIVNLGESITSGIGTDGVDYSLELTEGVTVGPEGSAILAFDNLSEGLSIDGGGVVSGLEPGVYVVDFQFDFDQPAEDRHVKVIIDSLGVSPSTSVVLHAEGADRAGYAYDQLVCLSEGTLKMSIQTTVLSSGGTPASLVMSYGYVGIKRIG